MIKVIIVIVTLILSVIMMKLSQHFDCIKKVRSKDSIENPVIDLDGEEVYYLNKNDKLSLICITLVCALIFIAILEIIYL